MPFNGLPNSKLFDASGEGMKSEPLMKNRAVLVASLVGAAFGIMILLSSLGPDHR